jgi:flagellin-like hook-associated protein FlgL
MIYDSGLASIQNRTSTLLRVQQQLASGRRILAPSDDPVAAARALEVTQSKEANKSQGVTRDNVKSAVGLADAQLQSATELLLRVRELTVQSGDAALSATDRRSVALELRQRFDELVAIANAKDGIGNSLFGGFQTGNKPFAGSVEDGVRYLGDDGLRALQVSNARQMGISQSGNDIFMRVQNGNGIFATSTQNDKSVNATHITYNGSVAANELALPSVFNTGSFEVKFWTDTAGAVNTAGYAAGSVAATYPLVVAAGTSDEFGIAIDGAAATTITIPPSPVGPPAGYADASALATAINTGFTNATVPTSGAGGVLASATADGRIIVQRTATGSTTGVTLTPALVGTDNALGIVFGTPVSVPGISPTAGATYYDFVDSSGVSLFTGATSATGAGGSYTHPYTSGTPISLGSTGATSFNYGASLVFTGKPMDGDSFAVTRTTTSVSVTEETITGNAARAAIDKGVVTDPLKWSQTANSGDIEARFWVDVQGTVATPAQSVGTTAPTYPLSFSNGVNDQFSVAIDGGTPIVVDMDTTGPSTTYLTPAALLNKLQAAVSGAAAVATDITFGAWTPAVSGANVATSADTGFSGLWTNVTLGAAETYSLTVSTTAGSVPLFSRTGGPAVTALDIDNAIASATLPIGLTVSGTAAGGDLQFTEANGNQVTVNVVNDSVVVGEGFAGPGFATGANTTINGVLANNGTPFSMTLNGAAFYTENGTVGGTVTAGDLDAALATFLSAHSNITKVGGSFATNNLQLKNSDGTGLTFAITPFSGGTNPITAGALAAGSTTAAGAPAVAGANVNFDANGKLVFTSKSSGASSSLAFANVTGTPLSALTGGVPGAASGADPVVGQTFYDLVDATTGKSLFTNTASTTGGAGNTYTHSYPSSPSSPTTINLSSVGGGAGQVAFDFGASVAVSGIPAGGDTFTIKSSQDYTGNGYFVTAAKTETAYNTGSGIIGEGDILDEAKWNHPANSRNLEVRFWQDPESTSTPKTTYYDLVDAENERSLFTNAASTAGGTGNTFTRAFKPGDAIDFSGLNVLYGSPSQTITDFGISVTIDGQPASGDAFKVRASESQSIFDTLANTIQLLESGKPVETMGNVQFHNELGAILSSLGRAENSILSARAVFGSNLSEVDSLDSVGESLNIQFEDTLSSLQDLDYAEAITKLTRQQMELQAAQQSFSKISQLTLFDYI